MPEKLDHPQTTKPPEKQPLTLKPNDEPDRGEIASTEAPKKVVESGKAPADPPASGAPELDEVSVTAAPEPEPKPVDESKNEPPVMIANAGGSAGATVGENFKDRIAAQEKVVSTDPNNMEEQYRLRMMYLIDGQDDRAKAVIPGVDADLQQIITAQIESLISARSTSGRDPATWATRQLEGIEELRRLVRERADLLVPKVALCTNVEGFGRYTPIESTEFKAGKRHKVLIYIEVDNFITKQTNSGMYRTLLSVRNTLLTKAGKEIWSEKSENVEDLARRPRRDFYLCTLPITIPKTLPPDEYVLKVEVEDVLAGKINSNVATFKLVP